MAEYKLYCLDANGRISLAEWFQADSDEDAVRIAHELKPDARRCEVWAEGRLVGAFDGR